MQARGQTQSVTLPITALKPGQEPGHRATLQPGRAGWGGTRWRGGSVGVRSFQVSFHFLLSAPPPPFWGRRRVYRLCYYAGDRSLDTCRLYLEACRWCDGLDLKIWRLGDKRWMSFLKRIMCRWQTAENSNEAKAICCSAPAFSLWLSQALLDC